MTQPHLCLIDVSGFIFRAYYALPPLNRASDGAPVGAVAGVCHMLRRLPSMLPEPFTHAAAVFDTAAGSFRKDLAPSYKSNRSAAPDDLKAQFGHMRPAAQAFGFPALEVPMFEADDIIASYATSAAAAGYKVTIISADKDLLQLLAPNIVVFDPVKNTYRTPEDARTLFGVDAHLIAHVQALAGDSSDGVAGIPSIGLKTAATLINAAGSLEDILANPQLAKTPRLQNLLREHADAARLAYQLVLLRTDAPQPQPLDALAYTPPAWEQVRPFLEQLELRALLKSMAPAHVPAVAAPVAVVHATPAPVITNGSIEQVTAAAHASGICALYPYNNGCIAFTAQQYGVLLSPTQATALNPLWQNAAVLKIVQNGKHLLHSLPLVSFHDAAVLAYASTGVPTTHPLPAPDMVEPLLPAFELLQQHAAAYAQAAQHEALALYQYVDRPLLPAVAAMEQVGVHISAAAAARVSAQFAQRIATLDATIFSMAGREFMLNSPKQLSEVLFGELAIAPPRNVKRNASGYYPTGVEVLELLEHPLAPLVLERRHLHKLQSTYADALPQHINPTTGRVHGQFSLCSTATGRLASSEPNLQNIPIRTEEGRLIRALFTAPAGNILLAADYSQIELRLLAHMAGVDALKQAFANNIDVHTMVAAEVFGVPMADVTPELRRRAKAVNFGIIYGLSAHGLAKQLHIAQGAARDYIAAYFARFPQIKDYMTHTIASARAHGYVRTLFGRKVLLPLINDKLATRRAAAERAAINAPIQGTGADIMRRAAVKLHNTLLKNNLAAKVVLQVHDEVLCEAPTHEAAAVAALMAQVLPHAALPLCPISVPLTVEVKQGLSRDMMEGVATL